MNKIVLSATFAALFFAYYKCNLYLWIFLIMLLGICIVAKKIEFAVAVGFIILISFTSLSNYYMNELRIGSSYTVMVEPVQGGKLRLLSMDGKKLRRVTLIKTDVSVSNVSRLYGELSNVSYENGFTIVEFHVVTSKESAPIFRQFLSSRITRISHRENDLNGFLQAAILGDSQYLSKSFYTEMKDVNGLHLITISGMHVSMILLLVIYFLSILQLPYLARYSIALGVLTLYILAVNFSVSVERAYIMGLIFLIAKLVFSEYDSKKSLKIAYILSLTVAPLDLFSPSFQLSYVALFAIIYFFPYCQKMVKNTFLQFLLLSLIIQLCLQPIFLATFKQMNLLGFLNNIILIPFGSLIIGFGFITLMLSIPFYPIIYIFSPILGMIFKSFEFYLGFLTLFGKFTFSFDTPYNGTILWIFFIMILIFMWYNDEERC
ncbi:MAG: ComEC/Rec2 family competence protein [Fusobacteria bacterium]|nr:ComEC/Rec2 family competence protein [Fusobacteriota bacterium]